MNKKITSLILLPIISLGAQAQVVSEKNENIEIKAVINPGCFLNADDINFGILSMPITNQSASSNMRVLCSKNTDLSIEIVYGASTSGGQTSGTFTAVLKNSNAANHYKINKDGVAYTKWNTDVSCSPTLGMQVYSQEIANLYNVTYVAGAWQPDVANICSGKNINTSTLASLGIPSQGKLTGLSNGEQIAFSIEVPNNSTQVWNSTNKYPIITTGIEQSIPMKANIKSSENPTHRMSPDIYQSILTVVVTY